MVLGSLLVASIKIKVVLEMRNISIQKVPKCTKFGIGWTGSVWILKFWKSTKGTKFGILRKNITGIRITVNTNKGESEIVYYNVYQMY